jgi:nitrite reductase/ring-hydroxylating ferredoxin subunit
MATYAQFERRLIGQRTREALAVKCAAVLVTRSTSGDICAIANTCSHFGGPRAQGEREGDVVVCPWHGSRFDVCTGDVAGGPAVFPQPRFEARARDGTVEIRRAE